MLVEFPQLALPAYSDRMLEIVAAQGWTPVLAHPERYAGIATQYHWIERWREMGVVLCLNVGSLLGEHGRDAERVARRMLTLGHADIVASDNHARPHRNTLLDAGWDLITASGGVAAEDVAARLMSRNPRGLLDGMPIDPVPALELPSGWLDRLKRWRR